MQSNNSDKVADLRATVVPRSDQINFEDVQSQSITAVIKSVRAGNAEQPVFIDLEGYEGRPYKPSKSMRRVLIGGWGADGHSWVGRTITITGDPAVKFGGVAVGGIKIHAMSDIDADFSMMLSVSRGKRSEHRVKKLEVKKQLSPQEVVDWFTNNVMGLGLKALDAAYDRAKKSLSEHPEMEKKVTELYQLQKSDLEKNVQV